MIAKSLIQRLQKLAYLIYWLDSGSNEAALLREAILTLSDSQLKTDKSANNISQSAKSLIEQLETVLGNIRLHANEGNILQLAENGLNLIRQHGKVASELQATPDTETCSRGSLPDSREVKKANPEAAETLIGNAKFRLGQTVWASMNGEDFAAKIHAITFHEGGLITYDLHNEQFKHPESYLTIPEFGLSEERDV